MNKLTNTSHEQAVTNQVNDARSAAVAEICRLQKRIDGQGVKLTKAAKKDVFDALETATTHIGLTGVTETAFVSLINSLRGQGLLLQEICQHKQLSFALLQPVQDLLPFDFANAKARASLAEKLPEEVKTIEEAREVYRLVLEEVELLKIEQGAAGGVLLADKMTRMFNTMKLMKQDWQKTLRVAPLERCSQDRLRDFLDVTGWIDEERSRAKEILSHYVA